MDDGQRDHALKRWFGPRTRVVVTGSRDDDGSRVEADLDALKRRHGRLRVAHGGAKGADAAAARWARSNRRVKEAVYPADWTKGRGAGPRRNRAMLDAERPDLVLAYPAAQGKGTQDAMRYAESRGIRVENRSEVSKGVKVVTRQLGPYKRTERSISIRRPTKMQQRAEYLREVTRAVGTGKIVVAAGAGVAGSEFARKERAKAKRAAGRTLEVVGIKNEEKKPVKKAFDIDDIRSSVISKQYGTDLVEVRKFLFNSSTIGGLGRLFSRGKQAVSQGYQSGGVGGALNAGNDFVQQTGRQGFKDAAERSMSARLGTAAPSAVPAQGAGSGLVSATNTSVGQQLSRSVGPPSPASKIGDNIPGAVRDNAGKIGAGVAGAGALAGGAYLGGKFLKKKAKKYAAIGAAGLGGSVAAGTALGNTISN